MDELSNFLLWGVETDKEVQEIIRKFDKNPSKEYFKLSEYNPYMDIPKDKWTWEMKWNYECFKKTGKVMRKIQFKNPVFIDGHNVTCRKGIKWADATGALYVVETGHEDVIWGYAKVRDVKVISFKDIDDTMICNEHDPSCRSLPGLYAEMKRVYPHFNINEIVTLIYFDYEKAEV